MGGSLEEVKRDIAQYLNSVKGLMAIIVSDKDGGELLKVASDMAPDFATKINFISTNTATSEQANKLGLGRCQTISCFYGYNQVLHFMFHPLIITLIATNETNMGLLRGLESEFKDILFPDIRKLLEDALKCKN